jgi:hypothetical protein
MAGDSLLRKSVVCLRVRARSRFVGSSLVPSRSAFVEGMLAFLCTECVGLLVGVWRGGLQGWLVGAQAEMGE